MNVLDQNWDSADLRSDLFSISMSRANGKLLVQLEGEFDLASAPQLEVTLREAIENRDGHQICLDLSAVTFVDCSGWRPVISAARSLADDGAHLEILDPSPSVKRLVGLIGFLSSLDA
jgi:anti-sigma B factor antagonist